MLATKVMVVTGGPGTGKTTLMRGLLAALPTDVLRIQLAAPTGRAAKRLSESTGREARTLHRLLEAEPGRGFRRNPQRPLACDLLVVDEMSMVDLPLMAALVEALPDEAALLMVGDADQLPSVGPGQVLADLIASDGFPVLRLTEIFRQALDSGIVANAHRINRGETPVFAHADEPGDFYGLRIEDPEEAQAKLVELVAARIPERFGLDPARTCRCSARSTAGRSAPASSIACCRPASTRRRRPQHYRGETRYAVGDKVMQVENDYNREVWNGDIGRIVAVPRRPRSRSRWTAATLAYGFDELGQLVPAFAITVHKAQGSEYAAVVMPLARLHGRMLQRRLLYTAVSRAKKLVVLLAEPARSSVPCRAAATAGVYRCSPSGCAASRSRHDATLDQARGRDRGRQHRRPAGQGLSSTAAHELAIELKGEQDLVSIADKSVEELIRGELAAPFPGDDFLGEEGGGAGPSAAVGHRPHRRHQQLPARPALLELRHRLCRRRRHRAGPDHRPGAWRALRRAARPWRHPQRAAHPGLRLHRPAAACAAIAFNFKLPADPYFDGGGAHREPASTIAGWARAPCSSATSPTAASTPRPPCPASAGTSSPACCWSEEAGGLATHGSTAARSPATAPSPPARRASPSRSRRPPACSCRAAEGGSGPPVRQRAALHRLGRQAEPSRPSRKLAGTSA